MAEPDADLDDTIRLKPRRAKRRRHLGRIIGLVLVVAAAGSAGWLLHERTTVPSAMVPPSAPTVVPAQPDAAAPGPADGTRLASEAEILASESDVLTVFRLAANPRVLVLDFPSLTEQAHMLLRMAALVEVKGLPRDRILDVDTLTAAVRARGTEPDTFYYGHDYRPADLARFFALAARDRTALTPEELRLRDIVRREGWDKPGASGALISLPTRGIGLDAAARAAILRHELSHAEYFTDPAYAAHVARFWRTTLTAEERAAFRGFLAGQQYDPANEDLMMNEMQAHLVHTPDARFFNAAVIGIPVERLNALLEAFVAAMPPGWLRDATPVRQVAPGPPAPAGSNP